MPERGMDPQREVVRKVQELAVNAGLKGLVDVEDCKRYAYEKGAWPRIYYCDK